MASSAVIEPVVENLRIGGLVEVHGLAEDHEASNGDLGQLIGFGEGCFSVKLIDGREVRLDPANVRAATNLRRPGDQGASEASFDFLMAPRTDMEGLSHELAGCIVDKGFSVLRICHDSQKTADTVDALQQLAKDGKLSRFPEEVEEGYLGNNCRGKVAWLDPKDKNFADPHLWTGDSVLSYLASMFQPYAQDILGDFMEEKTPALVCLSLTDDEEPDFPSPEADDKVLGTFLDVWRRTLLRAVFFLGPGTAQVTLEAKDTEKAGEVNQLQDELRIDALPNTILLFRPDVYDFTCDTPDETLMLISNFLTPAPEWVWDAIEGDLGWLKQQDGPPAPAAPENIHVVNSVARLPAQMDSQWSYFAGLTAATDAVIKVPLERGDTDPYYTTNTESYESWQTTSCHMSFCEGVELFDNRHFEISNMEAVAMDPVQRLILETGAQSMAMIGLTKAITNRKSVHGGCAVGNDKCDWMLMVRDLPNVQASGALSGTSTVLAILANRFNFIFNMKGPSFVCDTACSASLTSTHCAKMMMQERVYDPLDFFLSLGAHLVLTPIAGLVGGTQSHMGGPYGRCLTFNASASGYLRGEGVSAIMLKWGNYKGSVESDAIMRATQVGQDGRSASLTAPNGPAQELIISRAIKEAKMTPPESTVWECHGTGTSLGDPIEVGSVRKIQIRMPRSEPLMITSNKTNIGHLEGGAAMAAMVKCVIQCKTAKCCPTVHLRTLNPHLEHAAFDAIFQTEGACYTYVQGHSQVSSFGFGGTNGHGIFWGQNLDQIPDAEKLFHKKLKERPPPEVRVMGSNPDDWEADFPNWREVDRSSRFTVSMSPNDMSEPLRYETLDAELAEDDDDATFFITGNFNNWGEERMLPGPAPGVHIINVRCPSGGSFTFRFLRDGSPDKVVAPEIPNCSSRTAAVLGPAAGLTNSWLIEGRPGQEFRIELLVAQGRRAVMWLAERS